MSRFLLFVMCFLLIACGPPPQDLVPKKKPSVESLRGASLGAPEEQEQQKEEEVDTNNDEGGIDYAAIDDYTKDIIVKNADADDEILVSPPNRKQADNPLDALEELHKGQRVQDFADVSKIGSDGYQAVFFSKLSSFVYFQDFGDEGDNPVRDMTLFMQLHNQTEAQKGDKQIPKDIMALNGKKIAVPGFMLAQEMKNGETKDFLLVQVIPSCFFCRTPNVTEWIDCKTLDEERLPYHLNKPVVVRGTMHVGSHYNDDYLEYIYKLDVDSIELLKK